MGGPIAKPQPRTLDRLRLRGGLLGWGDSEMGGSGGATGLRYFDLALALLNQRPRNAGNYGIGGQTIAQLAAVMQTHVLDRDPGMVLFQMATNDIGLSRTAAQILPDYAVQVDRARNAGIEPIIATIPPRTSVTSFTKEGRRLNAALRDYASDQGIIFLNPWDNLWDVTTNVWGAGYSDDSVHPNWTACKAAAANVVAQLGSFILPGGVYLANVGGTTYENSLLTDASFTGAVTSGLSNAWASSVSGGTVTYSQVADGSTGRNWQRIAVSVAPASMSISQQVPNAANANYSVGDELELSMRLKASGYVVGTDLGKMFIRFDFTNGSPSTVYLYNQLPADFTDSTWTIRTNVPTGTTAMTIRIGWNSGIPVLDIAQPTLINRTREGLTA